MSAVPPELLIFSHSMVAVQYICYILTANRPVIAQECGAPTDETYQLFPVNPEYPFIPYNRES